MTYYRNKEAFSLVQYQDSVTTEVEVVWVSCDTFAPPTIANRDGSGDLDRMRMRDIYDPNHIPDVGNRILVQLTEVDARAWSQDLVAANLKTISKEFRNEAEAVAAWSTRLFGDGKRPRVVVVDAELRHLFVKRAESSWSAEADAPLTPEYKGQLSPAEALHGFAGWMSSGLQVALHGLTDCSFWADCVKHFCETQQLDEPRENWERILKSTAALEASPAGDELNAREAAIAFARYLDQVGFAKPDLGTLELTVDIFCDNQQLDPVRENWGRRLKPTDPLLAPCEFPAGTVPPPTTETEKPDGGNEGVHGGDAPAPPEGGASETAVPEGQ